MKRPKDGFSMRRCDREALSPVSRCLSLQFARLAVTTIPGELQFPLGRFAPKKDIAKYKKNEREEESLQGRF